MERWKIGGVNRPNVRTSGRATGDRGRGDGRRETGDGRPVKKAIQRSCDDPSFCNDVADTSIRLVKLLPSGVN